MKTNFRYVFNLICVGLLLYIVNLLFSSIVFLKINKYLYEVLFGIFIILGCFIFVIGLYHHRNSLFQKVLKFFLIIFSYLFFFLLGAYSGVARWFYAMFKLEKVASNNNVSGLFSLIFFFALIFTGTSTLLFDFSLKIIKAIKKLKKSGDGSDKTGDDV